MIGHKMSRAFLAVIALGTWLGVAAPVWATEQIIFGPQEYTRTAGPPNQFMETIALPPTLTSPYRLHIANGNADGSNRLSSASIRVNGAEVASQEDFSQQTAAFDRAVTLQALNTLQVRLTSLPPGVLILTLFGTVPPPVVTKLEPPTLPITQGGTGTLTATISASQPTDTTVSLTSSTPAIATVPASVIVPTGAVAVAVPVTGVAPGTATITASLNGSQVQSTITVAPAGPTLTSLLPATLQVTQGASGILTVTISAAQAGDTVVSLTTSNSSLVSLPPAGSVTVSAGQTSQTFPVFGVGPGTATITASLNGTSAESQVTVVVPLPTIVSLLPPTLPLTEGSSGSLTVTLNASQPTDTEVFLTTSDPTIVGLPGDRVTVPAHTLSIVFPVTGLTPGTATVTAALNGTSATTAITVSPPLPTLQTLTCPATLTEGATALCTVTLNATQLVETLIPLSASDAGILTVPPSVTVPANTLTASFAVTGLAVGSAVITAGPLNGTTQSASVQVLPPPPTLASLTPPTATLFVGATVSLTLTLNATQLTDTVIPLSASPSAVLGLPSTVTVAAGSLTTPITVTGLTPGTATVTAGPLNGTSVQSTITVNQLPPTVSALTPGSLSLAKGRVGTLTLTIAPTQAEATVVPLASSDPSVEVPTSVTVPAGAATADFPALAQSEGSAIITAGPLNGTSQTATVTVTPAELLSLVITPPAPTIAKGQTQQFTATGTYTDGTAPDLTGSATWTSSDPTVAPVTSPGGLATGLTPGQVTLTAAVGSMGATATLTVTEPILASIAVSPASPTRNVGDTLQFQAVGTLTDGTTQDLTPVVTWTSSDATVATISATGLATALATGTTTITALHPEGFTASTTLTVILPPPTLTGFSPSAGKVGTSITITGTNFFTVASVSFNGTAAPGFMVNGLTSITAAVPAGATTGPISVTTSAGTATSTGSFVVLPTQDVTLAVEPTTVTAIAGTSVSLKVSTVATGGFTGLVTLGTGTLPAGVTAAFSTPALGPNASGLLTLTTSGTTPSPAAIEVRGTATLDGTAITRTATATLAIQPAGETVLAGQVRDENDQPLANVTLKLGGSSPTALGVSDAAGNFLVSLSVAGTQVFLVDGSTASTATVSYPTIPVTLTIQPGLVNTLGFIPHLHFQKTTGLVDISNSSAQRVVTDPSLPGFQMTIPTGVTITGWDGQPNAQVSIRKVPLDRNPLPPLPADRYARSLYMDYFGKVGGGTPSQPIPITAPNDLDVPPGTQVELWYYDEAPDGSRPNAWAQYGTGTVSADGSQVIPDINPATGQRYGQPRFCCGAMNVALAKTRKDAADGPRGGSATGAHGDGRKGGEPVDLATGIFLLEKTDLVVPGRLPIVFTRSYRTQGPTGGPFGPGTSHTYNIALLLESNLRTLLLPNGGRIPFARQADGTFRSASALAFQGAVLTESGGLDTLRFKDGATWSFGSPINNTTAFLIGQQDRNGNRLFLTRSGPGQTLTALTDQAGRQLSFDYDASNRITAITDPVGRTVRYTYNAAGYLETATDPAGGITRYTYDASNRLQTITDPRGITFLTNAYDANGRVSQQTQADGGIWTFAYTVTANVVTQTVLTDPRGNATISRFNGDGYLIQQTDALGQTTTYTRDPSTNQLLATTDPLGRVTQFTYDGSGNVLTITDPLNNTRTFTYDPTFNKVTSITDPLGNLTTFEYDNQGNLTAITDPLQNTQPAGSRLKTTFTYNPFGQPLTTTDPLGHTTTFTYDDVGDLTAVSDPLGNTTTRSYDVVSRLLVQTDPLGKTTRFSYDPLNRLVGIVDALNGGTTFGYDPNGNLLTVTDARGNTITHQYDSVDRLSQRVDQLGKAETFGYDGNGNLVSTTDRKNQTTTFTYDPLNRRTQASYADGAVATFTYDAASRLTQADDTADPHRPITLAYDNLDRLLTESTTLGTVTYAYDTAGRRTSMTVSGQAPVNYTYDANSRLRTITQSPLNPVDVQYDAAGRRTLLTLPNGVSTEYQYDLASRLTALIYRNALGPLGDLQYGYDAAGNRTAVGGSFARTLLPDAVASAAYDQGNRQLAFGAGTMSFDDNGNLLTQTDPSGTITYTWDARNRLTMLTGPSVNASFAYDGLGRRARKTVGNVTTEFLYDGLDIVKETSASGDARYLRTLAVDEAVVRTDPADTVHYLADGLQSTVALTDSTAAAATTYTYEPFGRTSVSGLPSSNPFQFTGRENDGTGLYFYRGRYFSMVEQRFLSEDPLNLASVRFLRNPLSLEGSGTFNQYWYVQNSPLRFRDPLGLFTIVGGLGGSAVARWGVEASGGGYYDWSSGEAGGFLAAGVGAGLNVSVDIFGGVVWGNLEGVTANTNIVVGPISVTVMIDPLTGKPVGGTVGWGPMIPGIPPVGISETISGTVTKCFLRCSPPPPACLGCRK